LAGGFDLAEPQGLQKLLEQHLPRVHRGPERVRITRDNTGSPLATTKLSSKGQVVIPEEIRERLGLKEGAQFIVIGERDVVILKSIAPPTMAEFDDLVRQARGAARKAGLRSADVRKAVSRARAGR
jgi:AbrB family looped-hinge helix DNA binding protein